MGRGTVVRMVLGEVLLGYLGTDGVTPATANRSSDVFLIQECVISNPLASAY